MPQSLSAVHLHAVFSTKGGTPFFQDKNLREETHAYLGGISKQLECQTLIVGGVEDHVHVLARFGRGISQSEWIKEIKRVSSQWIKRRDPALHDFSWQSGYGVFSVSPSRLDAVRHYIATQ